MSRRIDPKLQSGLFDQDRIDKLLAHQRLRDEFTLGRSRFLNGEDLAACLTPGERAGFVGIEAEFRKARTQCELDGTDVWVVWQPAIEEREAYGHGHDLFELGLGLDECCSYAEQQGWRGAQANHRHDLQVFRLLAASE